jgi:adenylate cyclase
LVVDRVSDEAAKASSKRVGERILAAVMFTDIVGYTAITQVNEERSLRILDEHNRLLRSIFEEYGAEEIKTIGDSFLLVFRNALDAVRCAQRIQRAIAERNAVYLLEDQFKVRIGIHVGDVIRKGGDVFGDTVNLASRIERVAEAGEVVISSQVYEHVRNKTDFAVIKLGEYRLKNVDTPVLIYKISEAADPLPLLGGGVKKERMVILPLVVISESASDEYLAEGLTEELISAFSSLSALKVVAKNTAMRYKAREKSVSEIGKELNVGTVLQGNIRRWENRLRIIVQLIDAETEEYLWSQTYDRDLKDVLDVQQDIAKRCLESLRGVIGKNLEGAGVLKRITENTDAYVLYLRGRYHLTRHSEFEVKTACELFAAAVDLDPRFASAYAMQAQCHMFLGFFGFTSPIEGFERAEPLLKRAVELNGDLDIAHMLLGRLFMDKYWDWGRAEAEFRRAVELSPSSAEAHYRYALLLHDLGRGEEALAEVKKAVDLDPLSVAVNQVAGTVCYFMSRTNDAIQLFQRALEVEPKAALAHNNIGLSYIDLGRIDEGITEVRRAIELDPKNAMFKADLCYVYARIGHVSDAKELLASSEKEAATARVPPVAIAGMYASVGEKVKAMDWLWKAYAEHSPYLSSLKVERWFDGMRDEPSFLELLRRIGLL